MSLKNNTSGMIRKINKKQKGGFFKGKKRQRGRIQKGGFPAVAAAMLVPSILGLLGIGK